MIGKLTVLKGLPKQNQSVTKLRQNRHGDKLFGTERGFLEIKQLPPLKRSQGWLPNENNNLSAAKKPAKQLVYVKEKALIKRTIPLAT